MATRVGMPAFADYLRARGMKLGLYTARNLRTCSGKMPGSLGNEVVDAKTFAAMGAEFLKNVRPTHPSHPRGRSHQPLTRLSFC